MQEKEPSQVSPSQLSKSSSKQSTVSIKNSEKTDYNTLYNTQVKQNEKYEEILDLFIQHAVKIECRMVPQTKNQIAKFYEGITVNSLMVKVQEGIKLNDEESKDLSFQPLIIKFKMSNGQERVITSLLSLASNQLLQLSMLGMVNLSSNTERDLETQSNSVHSTIS